MGPSEAQDYPDPTWTTGGLGSDMKIAIGLKFVLLATTLLLPCGIIACSPAANPDDAANAKVDPLALSKAATEERSMTAATPAQAGAFGFALRSPVTLPECESMTGEVTFTCRVGESIFLGKDEAPDFLDSNTLSIVEDPANGLQMIHAGTTYERREEVLASLLEKYGPPDWNEGFVADGRVRLWTFSNLRVTFTSFSDLSTFSIRTPEQAARDEAENLQRQRDEEAAKAKQRTL